MDVVPAEAEVVAMRAKTLDRARAHLQEALAIIDELNLSRHIGARLQEAIDVLPAVSGTADR